MPIYVYGCDTCGMTFERRQAITAPPLKECPECEGKVQRLIQPVGVVFKGSGFYVTDHKPSRKPDVPETKKECKENKESSSKSAA